jgi:hypothetical protein
MNSVEMRMREKMNIIKENTHTHTHTQGYRSRVSESENSNPALCGSNS